MTLSPDSDDAAAAAFKPQKKNTPPNVQIINTTVCIRAFISLFPI
jgi:hypothetical protein